ncbi:uncharacterized protein LOC131929937 [Physella acuta]|uniref:uncharacterized protein LOC131929937 n=1 Tax=Physella acuta TaxID=109671 RepID=UPI0027DD2DDE|nr:uncharacterized protein LOC131929937 [Physella acuta]
MSKDYNLDIDLGTTWSFKFDGDDFFGMCVLMADSKYSADTFTALPIAGWGTRYIAMTLHENPTINIVNGDEVNTVTLNIKITWSDGPKELKWNDVNYKNGDKLEVNLRRWEGFVFSYCPLDYNRHGSFTGINIYIDTIL